jgi:hypothetical protein
MKDSAPASAHPVGLQQIDSLSTHAKSVPFLKQRVLSQALYPLFFSLEALVYWQM